MLPNFLEHLCLFLLIRDLKFRYWLQTFEFLYQNVYFECFVKIFIFSIARNRSFTLWWDSWVVRVCISVVLVWSFRIAPTMIPTWVKCWTLFYFLSFWGRNLLFIQIKISVFESLKVLNGIFSIKYLFLLLALRLNHIFFVRI